jgi:hypothetical protein
MPRICTICIHPARAVIDEKLITGLSIRAISGQYGLRKSAVHRHRSSHLPARLAQEGADLQAEFQGARQVDRWHYTQLRRNARAVMRAMQGWGQIRSPEEWQQVYENAHKEYASGGFILKRLGGERFLDPEAVAVLLQLRQDLMDQCGTASSAMTMLIDLAVMAYYNALRIQGWIGDLALVIEQELFAEDALKLKLRQQYGAQIDGFAVEEALRRLREQLIPLFQQVNRQLLQHLQALQRRGPGPSPMVAIGRAGHVNVAQQQVNIQRKNGRSSQPVDPRGRADGSQPQPPMEPQRWRRGHRAPVKQIDV